MAIIKTTEFKEILAQDDDRYIALEKLQAEVDTALSEGWILGGGGSITGHGSPFNGTFYGPFTVTQTVFRHKYA